LLTRGLLELKNNVSFFFYLINAFFVLIVFLLTLNKDKIYIDWPLGIRENITFVEETNEVSHQQTTTTSNLVFFFSAPHIRRKRRRD
jgi:hypothetical protein